MNDQTSVPQIPLRKPTDEEVLQYVEAMQKFAAELPNRTKLLFAEEDGNIVQMVIADYDTAGLLRVRQYQWEKNRLKVYEVPDSWGEDHALFRIVDEKPELKIEVPHTLEVKESKIRVGNLPIPCLVSLVSKGVSVQGWEVDDGEIEIELPKGQYTISLYHKLYLRKLIEVTI